MPLQAWCVCVGLQDGRRSGLERWGAGGGRRREEAAAANREGWPQGRARRLDPADFAWLPFFYDMRYM